MDVSSLFVEAARTLCPWTWRTPRRPWWIARRSAARGCMATASRNPCRNGLRRGRRSLQWRHRLRLLGFINMYSTEECFWLHTDFWRLPSHCRTTVPPQSWRYQQQRHGIPHLPKCRHGMVSVRGDCTSGYNIHRCCLGALWSNTPHLGLHGLPRRRESVARSFSCKAWASPRAVVLCGATRLFGTSETCISMD